MTPPRTVLVAVSYRALLGLSVLGSVGGVLAGCGTPVVATPMPEPPSIDLSRMRPPGPVTVTASTRYPLELAGDEGAAPPNATVYATNLDDQAPTVTTVAAADGTFALVVTVGSSEEIRFQVAVNGARGRPVDCRIRGALCIPIDRPTCISLNPGLELDWTGLQAASLEVRNDCADSLTVSDPRARLTPPQFVLPTTLPMTLAPAETRALTIERSQDASGNREDVLFLSLTLGTSQYRYPITLHE